MNVAVTYPTLSERLACYGCEERFNQIDRSSSRISLRDSLAVPIRSRLGHPSGSIIAIASSRTPSVR